MTYLQAANYTPGRLKPVRLIVIHTMESPEGATTAMDVATYFHRQSRNNSGSSAHYCIDARSIVQCVDESDTAWAAPGANSDGVQFEHAGMASQTALGWADPYSRATLERSAGLAAVVAARHGIPLRHLSDDELAAGHAGFVGHVQVSRVYRRSDHTDPGAAFPWVEYMALVAGGPSSSTPPEAPMVHDPLDANDAALAAKTEEAYYTITPPGGGKEITLHPAVEDALARLDRIEKRLNAPVPITVDLDKLAAATAALILPHLTGQATPEAVASAVWAHVRP